MSFINFGFSRDVPGGPSSPPVGSSIDIGIGRDGRAEHVTQTTSRGPINSRPNSLELTPALRDAVAGVRDALVGASDVSQIIVRTGRMREPDVVTWITSRGAHDGFEGAMPANVQALFDAATAVERLVDAA